MHSSRSFGLEKNVQEKTVGGQTLCSTAPHKARLERSQLKPTVPPLAISTCLHTSLSLVKHRRDNSLGPVVPKLTSY